MTRGDVTVPAVVISGRLTCTIDGQKVDELSAGMGFGDAALALEVPALRVVPLFWRLAPSVASPRLAGSPSQCAAPSPSRPCDAPPSHRCLPDTPRPALVGLAADPLHEDTHRSGRRGAARAAALGVPEGAAVYEHAAGRHGRAALRAFPDRQVLEASDVPPEDGCEGARRRAGIQELGAPRPLGHDARARHAPPCQAYAAHPRARVGLGHAEAGPAASEIKRARPRAPSCALSHVYAQQNHTLFR